MVDTKLLGGNTLQIQEQYLLTNQLKHSKARSLLLVTDGCNRQGTARFACLAYLARDSLFGWLNTVDVLARLRLVLANSRTGPLAC